MMMINMRKLNNSQVIIIIIIDMREQNNTILTYTAQIESQRINYFVLERFSLFLLCKTQRSNLGTLGCAKNLRNWNPSIHPVFNRIRRLY